MRDRLLMGWIWCVVIASFIMVSAREPETAAEAPRSVPETSYPYDWYQTAEMPSTTLVWAVDVCGEALEIARQVGWPEEEMVRVYNVVWRESRCLAHVHNADDPRGGSHGLMQINGFWCRPNPTTGWPIGYLQAQGLIHSCDDLYDPATNLRAALHIWSRSGWAPWGTVG